jgi:hypothetical protein
VYELLQLLLAFAFPFAVFFAGMGFAIGLERLCERYKRFRIIDLLLAMTMLSAFLGVSVWLIRR